LRNVQINLLKSFWRRLIARCKHRGICKTADEKIMPFSILENDQLTYNVENIKRLMKNRRNVATKNNYRKPGTLLSIRLPEQIP
jgi:hypothetical protein